MNKTVARMIALAMIGAERFFRLVHSAGKRGIKSMTEYMSEELGLSDWKEAGFDVVDYILWIVMLFSWQRGHRPLPERRVHACGAHRHRQTGDPRSQSERGE